MKRLLPILLGPDARTSTHEHLPRHVRSRALDGRSTCTNPCSHGEVQAISSQALGDSLSEHTGFELAALGWRPPCRRPAGYEGTPCVTRQSKQLVLDVNAFLKGL